MSMMKRLVAWTIFAFLLILSLTPLGGCAKTTVTTLEVVQLDSGPISGVLNQDIWSFKGIPYAAPPLGELRWKEPQPVTPWKETRACTEFGPSCPQQEVRLISGGSVGKTSEDCLYLNVWTPAKNSGERLPVMVWIHGGGFENGSGSQPIYDGQKLAEMGVVVVTINYRLGPLGFLAHPLLTEESPNHSSGNYGMLDQIEALKWVQRNIEAFGGDKNRVTIFGESAGGISVCDLMVSSLANGLFHRVISESGPYSSRTIPTSTVRTLKDAEKTGIQLADALGCSKRPDTLDALRSKTPEELIKAGKELGKNAYGGLTWSPVIDGWFLHKDPAALFAEGSQQDVPLLVGFNADEGTIFAPEITLDQYNLFLGFAYGRHASDIMALFPAQTPDQVKPALIKLITQVGFASQAKFAAASMATKKSKAYLYQFTKTIDNPLVKHLGSFHGLEIPFVFGNLNIQNYVPNEKDKALSQAIMKYWTSFAANGVPSGEGLPTWPAYESASDQYMELGDAVIAKSGLFTQIYTIAEKLLRGE